MSELLLLLILAFIFIFTPDTYIGSKYRLSVYLICNNRYRYRPWKTHIGRPLSLIGHSLSKTAQLAEINKMMCNPAVKFRAYSHLFLCIYRIYIFFPISDEASLLNKFAVRLASGVELDKSKVNHMHVWDSLSQTCWVYVIVLAQY